MSDESTGGDPNGSAAADEAATAETADVLDELCATIEDRKRELPEGSYTASLFTHEKGENAVLEKIGEETTETILAAKDDDEAELLYESADLVYHLLVLLAMKDLDVDDLRDELESRFG
ncbi:phosphoribosyl-ATP diphosphatase [Halopenitus persicus]|uniref:phosphoribosyl-ATP diphosphatase n=1 Tax=Halopenitus persicus TaxID=1048396 RepID=UPI000BBB05D8|nr:phosphoribosyl-ATP diphosphatase [Halopenitus persicus]